MNRYQFKDKIKSVKKTTWMWWGLTAFAIILGIALGIVAMYLSGYTLLSWLKSFYPWVIVGIGLIAVIVTSVLIYKYRKGR